MNDNIMSMEEIEKMLKESGQLDDTPEAEETNEAVQEEVAQAETSDTAQGEATEGPVSVSSEFEPKPRYKNEDFLTQEEQDVLGEIGNICMGTSATTMYNLLGKRVNITTPRITVHDPKSLADGYKAPMVVVDVNYVKGIEGKNLLILDEYDVALMTDVLMGGDGKGIDKDNVHLDEMHMSAIREVMNQMVGSSATSLANIINTTVDISTPNAHHISLNEDGVRELFAPKEILVKISFDMVIDDLLESKIMQILPMDFAKTLADALIGGQPEEAPTEAAEPQQSAPAPSAPAASAPAASTPAPSAPTPSAVAPAPTNYGAPAPSMVAMPATNNVVRSGVNAQEVEYPNFDVNTGYVGVPENIALLSNVPMKVTVQLGKAKKKVKEILEFNNGSVIVLDKLAGEPVDILVNGKHIAKGEVVVVDDSYGVRITEIDSAALSETL